MNTKNFECIGRISVWEHTYILAKHLVFSKSSKKCPTKLAKLFNLHAKPQRKKISTLIRLLIIRPILFQTAQRFLIRDFFHQKSVLNPYFPELHVCGFCGQFHQNTSFIPECFKFHQNHKERKINLPINWPLKPKLFVT